MHAAKLFAAFSVLLAAATPAQQVPITSGSVAETVAHLRPGEYVWAPEVAPSGPVLLVVNLKTQRATLFRNGVPIAASTVSTGRPGYSTPTGVFTVLQKHVEHYSSKYDNAPMPYMQRLTWGGIALHAGNLPGRPASHGCIRLPHGFAKLLYGVTKVGMTVVVADVEAIPKLAPTPELVSAGISTSLKNATIAWHPERSASGPVSIVVSAADHRATVLRNGIVIGSAPVSIDGPVAGTWAYSLRNIDAGGQHWLRIAVGAKPEGTEVAREEWKRFRAPDEFRRAVAQIVEPGTTVVVTADSLVTAETGSANTILDSAPQKR
jgi:hypothetical protein